MNRYDHDVRVTEYVNVKDVVDESEKNPTSRHALVVGEAR
jgi:hypothetical protein